MRADLVAVAAPALDDLPVALQIRPEFRSRPSLAQPVSRRLAHGQDLLQRLPVDPGLRQDRPLAHSFYHYALPDRGPLFHIRVHLALMLGATLFNCR